MQTAIWSGKMGKVGAGIASLVCAVVLVCALSSVSDAKAWAEVQPGIYTATVTASYANPDTGEIADAGGQSNATLGQSMVEGLVQPSALVQSDGTQTLVTVRFGQAGLISDVRVAADPEHDGTFGDEQPCTVTGENPDEKLADYQFSVEDDAATLLFSMYVEPMGRDVSCFAVLTNPVEGNTAGFAQTLPGDAASPANSGTAASSDSAAADSASAISADAPASSASAGEDDAASMGTSSEGLNMPLIIGLVVAAVIVIALVAYFAAIRPGKAAAQQAAREAEKRERIKRS